jgi:hypothetical protein
MTDDAAISEALALCKRRSSDRVLNHDANELATRSGCRLRVVKRDGKGLILTAELDPQAGSTSRPNDDVIVATFAGSPSLAS